MEQIVDGLRFVHKHKGYLQVDGNELNYMVTDKYNDLYFIDVNSFKTPSFPADAIMPSIRDWNAGTNFTELTDWYSFAIISFYMFTGIHPFKGRHPRFPDLKTAMVEQMKAGVSVLDKDTQFPKAAVYFPFDTVIPANYLPWYRAIFVDGKRLPPPGVLSTGAAATIILKPQEITGTGNFDINELRRFMGQITGYLECNGREIVVTTDGIYVDNQPYNKINGRFRCGFTDKSFTPVALVIDGDKAMIWNIVGQNWLTDGKAPWFAFADDIMSYNGRLYIHYGQHIFEIGFIENAGPGIMVVQHPVATVMPKASRMYQGVVFQDVFGARLASIFPKSREHRQIKIAELAGVQITEAKFEGNVLMVYALDGEGQTSRFVFRFSTDWTSYDVRRIENVAPTSLNFTVLESGICVSITEEEKVEIFSNKKDTPGIKVITDPAIKSNFHLCHTGSQVRFAHNDKLYSFAIKK